MKLRTCVTLKLPQQGAISGLVGHENTVTFTHMADKEDIDIQLAALGHDRLRSAPGRRDAIVTGW